MKILALLLIASFLTSFEARANSCGPQLQKLLSARVMSKDTQELLSQISPDSNNVYVGLRITYKNNPSRNKVENVNSKNLQSVLDRISQEPNVESVTSTKLEQLSAEDAYKETVQALNTRKLKPGEMVQLLALAQGRTARLRINIQLKPSATFPHLVNELTSEGVPLSKLGLTEAATKENRRGADIVVTRENLPFVIAALNCYSVANAVILSSNN